jgi:hypothetical protein
MDAVGPLIGRDILAVALILTAAWKISHWPKYIASFGRLRPGFIRGLEIPARMGLVLSELACAGLLAAAPGLRGIAAEAGPALAIALLVMFTATILARPSGADCGCWSSPAAAPGDQGLPGPLLARNGTLLAACVAAAIPVRAAPSTGVILSALAFAAVLAPVILELPQVIAVVRYQGGIHSERAQP